MRYVSKSMLLGMTVLGGVLAATLAASAEDPKWVNGKLQPLSDGWPNEALSLYVIDDPGTTDSIFATALAKAAEAKSPVPIKIEHRPDFSTYSTWEAQAWLIKQGEMADNGNWMIVYTAPGNIVDLIATDMKTEAGVDLTDINYVNMVEELPYMIIQNTGVTWGHTLDDLIKYARANPETVRWIGGDPGAGQTAAARWYMSKLDFTMKLIVGGNSGERALAVASGDGDVTVSPPDVVLPHYEGGKVEVLMVGGDVAPPPWDKVPTAKSLGIEGDPWGTKRGLQVVNAVPEDHRAWLEELFREASKDEEFIANRKTVPGLSLNYRGGADVKTYMQGAWDAALPIMQASGVYWKDNKK
jgi:tripartite-type tricarboxylate transporter receptor subunit TctC